MRGKLKTRRALSSAILRGGVVGRVGERLREQLARVRPVAVGVRVVAFEHHVVLADEVDVRDPDVVGDEAAVDVVAEDLGRALRGLHARCRSGGVPTRSRPARAPTASSRCRPRTSRPQPREALEDPRVEQLHRGLHRVQPEQRDRRGERATGGDGRRAAAAEVEAHREVGLLEQRRRTGPSGRCGTTATRSCGAPR